MPMIASLFCGLMFGAGLLISGMVQPTKVLGFLDIFGAWDPSLAVVMVAALAVSVPGFMLANGRSRPLLTARSFWPTSIIRYRLGARWLVSGAGPGKPRDALARHHRLRGRDGRRHGAA